MTERKFYPPPLPLPSEPNRGGPYTRMKREQFEELFNDQPEKPNPPSIVHICDACNKPWKTCNCSEWYAAMWGFVIGMVVTAIAAGIFFGGTS